MLQHAPEGMCLSRLLMVGAEPTNHLDLEACVWLEDVLSKFKRILLLVSHSQVSLSPGLGLLGLLGCICVVWLVWPNAKLSAITAFSDVLCSTTPT